MRFVVGETELLIPVDRSAGFGRGHTNQLVKSMSEHENVLIAFTSCPSKSEANRLAKALVMEKLAACINQIPGVTSTYIWRDQLQTDSEVVLMMKTTANRFEALQRRVKELHPYELPELIAIPVCAGAENYLAWVRDTVT